MKSRSTTTIFALCTTLAACSSAQPHGERTDSTRAGLALTARIDTPDFAAELYQSGGYDKVVVVVEGFDPLDEFKPSTFVSPYQFPGDPQVYPPRLGPLVGDASGEGFDIWVVSAKFREGDSTSMSLQSLQTIAAAFVSQVHPQILRYGGSGSSRPYFLVGVSAGALISRIAASSFGAGWRSNILGYLSFEGPHEGAYLPSSLQEYVADHAICDDVSSIGSDPRTCHDRYVRYGIATPLARDLLSYRLEPTASADCPVPPSPVRCGVLGLLTCEYAWPSYWSDCHDVGGCTLPDDGRMSMCSSSNIHGNFRRVLRGPAAFNTKLGQFPAGMPVYAVSNGNIRLATSQRWAAGTSFMQTYVDDFLGDHHLRMDSDPSLLQLRGSMDPFTALLDGKTVPDARLEVKNPATFVSYDSAFGVHQGISWTGRLLGQCPSPSPWGDTNGNLPHDAVTRDTSDFVMAAARGLFNNVPVRPSPGLTLGE